MAKEAIKMDNISVAVTLSRAEGKWLWLSKFVGVNGRTTGTRVKKEDIFIEYKVT